MTLLHAGELNKRIAFYERLSRRGASGEPLPVESVMKGLAWAAMKLVSGRKIRTLDQNQVVQTWQFVIAPRADVRQGWQILLNNVTYTIRDLDNSQPDKLVITAEVEPLHDRASNQT